jgi:hypothetical protein
MAAHYLPIPPAARTPQPPRTSTDIQMNSYSDSHCGSSPGPPYDRKLLLKPRICNYETLGTHLQPLRLFLEDIVGAPPPSVVLVRNGDYMDSARRRPLVIYLCFPFVSYLSFRPSVPFSSDSSFLSVYVWFLHTRLLADLWPTYVYKHPDAPAPGNIRVNNQSFLSTVLSEASRNSRHDCFF